ncbi:MAG: SDR family oxidoreductase [Paracoccaceae bacterium]
MTGTWLILGGSSSMARAFARAVAERGDAVVLAGRDMADLKINANDCLIRGADDAAALPFDARDAATFGPVLDHMAARPGMLNVAVFVGSMPPQKEIDADPDLAEGVVRDSFLGPVKFLHRFAGLIEERGGGTVIGVGSVAGDRGRIGNYVYGAAKAAFHTYLAGLRNRLTRSGGHVVTVKPGFVDTAMTWGLPGLFLVASPQDVARDLLRAADRKRDVIYTPWFWRYIMMIIRSVPERIFKKLSV